MSNNLVAYSRAGDVFHYRWAARRCLRLIYPNSNIAYICIEGSSEIEKEGEYVIDVSEYSLEDTGNKKIDYYQLKHTTVQGNEPFTLSDLKDTFIGFAARYVQHKSEGKRNVKDISFTIITNRKFANSFKKNLLTITKKGIVDPVFKRTIESYTNLSEEDLELFCSKLYLEDSEGNYTIQKDELRIELTQLIAGSIENAQIENLVALVQEKVLPDSNGRINREDVLKRFGITSENELYPAPAKWDEITNIIERKQHSILYNKIANSSYPVIVHAAGGIGKSVFCRQLIESLPEESIGIAYDCFGAGSYRNRSESRHKHRDALVQIVNELASRGLCDPLIVQNTTLDEDIMRKFLLRIDTSVQSLKKVTDTAQLFILIDAADNAEMAAIEYNQSCFAHELIRENIPTGCKLVMLCRTERIHLLQPQSFITQLELEPFSEEETLVNIKKRFPEANEKDGTEFYRLTSGNPRVQANALDAKYDSTHELLASLGPLSTSIEKQIEFQLNAAISKIKDLIPQQNHPQIDSICLGLASLPPHIPIEVLSKVANVTFDHVKSFVSDIGRSLWLYDTSIQFRDEPTETWFRNTFLATKENYEKYITDLEPFAHQSPYIAQVLPQLYLQAGQYDKLITIALSEDYLPENNPIDARNIRVYRLQFAFKAALKLKNFKDAIKLAMRAGEEVAGNQRQIVLFGSNIDLITILQSKEKVQEIAFKRLLGSGWDGSESIYSASLLSGISDYRGEGRGYLRAAMNWLHIQFENQRKNGECNNQDGVDDDDVLELTYAHLNIHGVQSCTDFLNGLKPKEAVFRTVQNLVERLVDQERFDEINELIDRFIREPYYLIGTVSKLVEIGNFPQSSKIETCLSLLCSHKSRIKVSKNFLNDKITPSIISFLEACLYNNLSVDKICRVLNHYVPLKAKRMVYSSHSSEERTIYLKSLAIRAVLSGKSEVDIEAILPNEFVENKKNYELEKDIQEFKEVIYGLFPWYLLRAQILFIKQIKLLDIVDSVNENSKKARANRYKSYDMLPYEIAYVCSDILIIHKQESTENLVEFYQKFLNNNKAFKLQNKLILLRAACRNLHLLEIRQSLEQSTHELIKSHKEDGPEEIANRYIAIARAVLSISHDDASEYFDKAIKVVSKFGDELVSRWEAIVELAQKAFANSRATDELGYRFIRCAELIGENVVREKYWNRNEAIRTCTKMSPDVAISVLSRWRDRDVGRFEYQLEAMLIELVSSKSISASTGWALSRFLSYHQLKELLAICLENEPSNTIRKSLVDDAIYLFKIEGVSSEYWYNLKEIININNIKNDEIESILNFYTQQKTKTKDQEGLFYNKQEQESKQDWDNIFKDLNISTLEGFTTLVERFRSKQEKNTFKWSWRYLLKECINRLEENLFWTFIDTIFLSVEINHYDVQNILSYIPETLKGKVSYQTKLSNVIYKFGKRFAHELTNEYSFNSFKKELNLDDILIQKLITGIISGLANGDEITNERQFFGFITVITLYINEQDASELVNYSLSRFELHIEEDFGDGIWNANLYITRDINTNIAGFIWSALGAPKSEIRWKAVHCIRKIAEFNCINIIESLIFWLKQDKIGAFGNHKFPFYNLHARLYLLIALARVSLDKPKLLTQHKDIFVQYAFGEPHVLIQKFSAEIAINLSASETIYDEEILNKLKNVGKSNIPIVKMNYNETTDSYWHINKEIATEYDFHFGWDFDRYWFEPLANVFGIPGKQVEDIAANVIIEEWGIKEKNGYYNDPRVSIWNSHSNERETRHSHGSYPRIDNLDFYLSYHSIMVTAGKLIENMPVVSKQDWDEWISDHLLTCTDGKWLTDYRDPVPLKRPEWISKKKYENWKTDISENTFFEALLREEDDKELWFNVQGGWEENDSERSESFSIASALVSKDTSSALMRALETCSDPHDYKLPYYEERDMEIHSGTFELKGWIKNESISKKLDEHDPYAASIDYPPFLIGDDIADRLGLSVNANGKIWYLPESSNPTLKCEIWSSYRSDRDENPSQVGKRLKASLQFLKHMCATFNCDLILEVQVKRDINYKYQSNKDKFEYSKPKHKLFILSSNGELRTTGESQKFR